MSSVILKKRKLNEKKFGNWEALPDGGRKYYLNVLGKHGWKARYVKEVDNQENTIKFYQEIYDASGKLVEIHKKYPEDSGHKKVNGV